MSSICSMSPEFNWNYVDPTPRIGYVELSHNSTMHENCFSFRLESAPLYPDMCLEAPLSIIHVYSPVMMDLDKVETR